MRAKAPSDITLQAVPKLSITIYKVIIRVKLVSSNPNTDDKTPSEAIITPPGTPGAATATIASIITERSTRSNVIGIPCNIIMVMAQATIFIIDPGI